MSNVTKMPAKRETPAITDVTETVIRAKQIVRAIRVAQEQNDVEEEFEFALDQVYDMLEQAGKDLSLLEDDRRQQSQKPPEVSS